MEGKTRNAALDTGLVNYTCLSHFLAKRDNRFSLDILRTNYINS